MVAAVLIFGILFGFGGSSKDIDRSNYDVPNSCGRGAWVIDMNGNPQYKFPSAC